MKITTSTPREKKININITVVNRDKTVTRIKGHKIRKIYRFIRDVKLADGVEAILHVYYGKALDNFGKLTSFDNGGTYKTEKEFLNAFDAFTEKGAK